MIHFLRTTLTVTLTLRKSLSKRDRRRKRQPERKRGKERGEKKSQLRGEGGSEVKKLSIPDLKSLSHSNATHTHAHTPMDTHLRSETERMGCAQPSHFSSYFLKWEGAASWRWRCWGRGWVVVEGVSL